MCSKVEGVVLQRYILFPLVSPFNAHACFGGAIPPSYPKRWYTRKMTGWQHSSCLFRQGVVVVGRWPIKPTNTSDGRRTSRLSTASRSTSCGVCQVRTPTSRPTDYGYWVSLVHVRLAGVGRAPLALPWLVVFQCPLQLIETFASGAPRQEFGFGNG